MLTGLHIIALLYCWNVFCILKLSVWLACLQIVYGEIYYVDDKFMTHLDYFEGCPDSYQRDIISICIMSYADHEYNTEVSRDAKEKQKLVECNIYLLKNFDKNLLDKETFSSYDSAGPHGKPYHSE